MTQKLLEKLSEDLAVGYYRSTKKRQNSKELIIAKQVIKCAIAT